MLEIFYKLSRETAQIEQEKKEFEKKLSDL